MPSRTVTPQPFFDPNPDRTLRGYAVRSGRSVYVVRSLVGA